MDLEKLLFCFATTNRSHTRIAPRFVSTDTFYFGAMVIRSFGEGKKIKDIFQKIKGQKSA